MNIVFAYDLTKVHKHLWGAIKHKEPAVPY